jgi:transcriptional regulator with XRE-family HTH domain
MDGVAGRRQTTFLGRFLQGCVLWIISLPRKKHQCTSSRVKLPRKGDFGVALAALKAQDSMSTMLPMRFRQLGLAIRRCRLLQDMSVAELADKAGIHRNTLTRYESGEETARDTLNEKNFVKLCVALRMRVAEVLAVASIAKIEELLPLEAEIRAAMGLPVIEAMMPALTRKQRLETTTSKIADAFQSALELLSEPSNLEALVRLNPQSIQIPQADSASAKRASRRKKTTRSAGGDRVKRGGENP